MVYALFLAFSLSIDALGIGISYGLRRISFPMASRLLLAFETFLMMEGFLFLGRALQFLLPPKAGEALAIAFLLLFGLWLCLQGLKQAKEPPSPLAVVHHPSGCDKDASSVLEPREALLLGFILSIDSLGVGISAAAAGLPVGMLPFFSAVFQILFLSLGSLAGGKLTAFSHIPENRWTALSGGILIFLALVRFLC